MTNLIPKKITECSLINKSTGDTCMSSKTAEKVFKTTNTSNIAEAKNVLNCETERCVLSKLTDKIGDDVVRKELMLNLKVSGPTDGQLLSNIHIDNTLTQWRASHPDFYPYHFNMRNYMSYAYDSGYIINHPDTLSTILFTDLYYGEHDSQKYRCCACVINSDTYQGPGKHWMALFADARGSRWTVEFFNSSGNAPSPEWVSWMEKTKLFMERIKEHDKLGGTVEMIRVSSLRHQKSKSECGVYSLFYIWARLHGIPPEYFRKKKIPDELMFEFRQHLFNDPKRKMLKSFDWDQYQNSVNIKWESH